MTTFLIRQCLRTQALPRYKSVVVSYKRNHQLGNSSIKEVIKSSHQNIQNTTLGTKEKFNLNLKPSDLNKLLERIKSDVNTYERVNYKVFYIFVNNAVKDFLSPSEGVFLLNCCTLLPDTNKQQKSQLIETIWNDGIVRCGQPTKEHIISLLRAYKVIGRTIDDFNAFLAQYDCDADVELFEEFLYLTCENRGFSDKVVNILSDIENRGFPLTERLFSALILGHSRNGNVDKCEIVLDTMKLKEIKPTSETYMQLVQAYVESGAVAKATTLLNEHGKFLSQEYLFAIIKTAAIRDSINVMRKAMEFLPSVLLHNKNVAPGLRNICIELIQMDKVEQGTYFSISL